MNRTIVRMSVAVWICPDVDIGKIAHRFYIDSMELFVLMLVMICLRGYLKCQEYSSEVPILKVKSSLLLGKT